MHEYILFPRIVIALTAAHCKTAHVSICKAMQHWLLEYVINYLCVRVMPPGMCVDVFVMDAFCVCVCVCVCGLAASQSPGEGGRIARSAGSYATMKYKEARYAVIAMPSGLILEHTRTHTCIHIHIHTQ